MEVGWDGSMETQVLLHAQQQERLSKMNYFINGNKEGAESKQKSLLMQLGCEKLNDMRREHVRPLLRVWDQGGEQPQALISVKMRSWRLSWKSRVWEEGRGEGEGEAMADSSNIERARQQDSLFPRTEYPSTAWLA